VTACRDRTQPTVCRSNILGVGVSALNMELACETIGQQIAKREPSYICVSTVHCVMESQRDARYRCILNQSFLTTPDGMPLVWVSRLQGHPEVSRVYGPDLMLALFAASESAGYKHFLYGGASGVPEALAARLRERFPGAQVVGAYAPPFRDLTQEEEDEIVRRINGSGADIVWVGLGTPKQDYWMAEHLGRLAAPVMIGVGAAFDFHAGRKRQAPRWMQRSGLEWLFRLLSEPRRLWRRYLLNNPLFVISVALQMVGLHKYSLDAEEQASR